LSTYLSPDYIILHADVDADCIYFNRIKVKHDCTMDLTESEFKPIRQLTAVSVN